MSITSFSKPSDTDVLQNIDCNTIFIEFMDEGTIIQTIDETRYVRKVKVLLNQQEVLQHVVFVKSGIKWLFKKSEIISVDINYKN